MPSIPTHSFQVPLQEVDHAGVMFFAHLFSHAHDTYAQMMQSMGFPLHQVIADGDFHIPLVHAEADYLAPMRHGQQVAVSVSIESLGNTSFTLAYQFNTKDRQCARASTCHVFVDPSTGEPRPIPDNLRNYLVKRKDCAVEPAAPNAESDLGGGGGSSGLKDCVVEPTAPNAESDLGGEGEYE